MAREWNREVIAVEKIAKMELTITLYLRMREAKPVCKMKRQDPWNQRMRRLF